MLLSTIRSNLAALLAVSTALFAGYAYITHLHHQATKAQLVEVRAEKARLINLNEKQTATIAEMSRQQEISDSILSAVTRQADSLSAQGSSIEQQLQELGNNDSSLEKLRSIRLPDSAVRLLHDAAGGVPD